MARDEDYPIGFSQRVLDRFIATNFETGGGNDDDSFDFLELEAPTLAHDEAFRAWWVKAGHRGASPAVAREIQRVSLTADVRRVLPLVHVPTLILHRVGDALLPVTHGRFLAEHIPGATFVELPGNDDLHWVGDTTMMLDEIEEFVTGTRSTEWTDRFLTTILFTDIVGSTTHVVESGDRRWRETLERFEAASVRQLRRFGGRQINTTGDGALAIFDGPARAVTCAAALRDVAAQLGFELRAGVHTGEVELKGDDIAGIAVHVAARVQAAAKPNEVLVSRTVVDLVAGSGLDFSDRGVRKLKGVPGRWRLFAAEPS